MDWFSVLSSFITIGVLVDLLAMACMIRYEFGLSFNKKGQDAPYSTKGVPAGPIFYLLGLLQLIFVNKKSLSFVFVIFICCVLFYALVIFSAVIASGCVKLIRCLRARYRKVFYGGATSEISAKKTIEQAFGYLIDGCPDKTSSDIGFVYLTPNRAFKKAIIQVLASREIIVDAGEWDAGDIVSGRFASDMAGYGFPINHWRFDKRNRILVPFKDYSQIPIFINVLFVKYYNCGDNYQIRAEVLKMQR